MKAPLLCLCILAMGPVALAAAADRDLVADYSFDEGKGTIARDSSGKGNHGTLHGAKWVRAGEGYALEFDGAGAYVDCGKDGSLDITETISVEAWVRPATLPTVPSEWIVAGKQQDVYALTYYMDGRAWWYISGGDNACTAAIPVGQWRHLVGTFDGTTSTLYVNGEAKSSRRSKYPKITSRKDLPMVVGSRVFAGGVGGVKIYRRALPASEVKRHYESGKEARLARRTTVAGGAALRGDGFVLKAGPRGGMELTVGRDSYSLVSAFSYPGESIGWNRFSEAPQTGETWHVETTQPEPGRLQIVGKGKHYSLVRTVRLEDGRIKVEDTVTGRGDSPTGVIIENHIVAPAEFREVLLKGMPELNAEDRETGANPTVFVAQNESRVGLVAEDDISRLRFEASAGLNRATFAVRHFAVAPGKSHVLEWAVYPMGREANYYTFINRVREDWGSNFTIDGPFEFASIIYGERSLAPEALRAHLQRKPMRILGEGPFLEYPSESRVTRAEFRRHALATMKVLKAADPEINCIGSIEAGLVALHPEKIEGGDKITEYVRNYQGTVYAPVSPEVSRVIEAADLPWEDSFARSTDGRIQMEIFKSGGRTQTALMVTPAPGNYQHKYLMEQVKFLIDDVGMDGIYFDTFGGGRDTSRWDGFSVDIDPRTGRILNKYYDHTPDAARVRVAVCKYILSEGKIVVANGGNAGIRTEQRLPIFRVIENDPQPYPAGEKPPLNSRMCRLQLGSPVALIMAWGSAEDVYKAVINYLRQGIIPYFYNTNFPAAGKGSGEYGPFKHMYPLTPVGLHEGWIEARERIITCVSGNYLWKGRARPDLHLFDNVGREKKHGFTAQRTPDGWAVSVKVKDWQEIAVIEEAGGRMNADDKAGLVAQYTFDEGSGAVLRDTSPIGNHGKIVGAGWIKGEKGAALDFDGVGDSVDCGDDPTGRTAGPMTVAVWVRRTSNAQQYIVNRGGWNLYLLPDGRPVFETRTAENDAWNSLIGKGSVPLNAWGFVAAVFDTDAGRMEVFVNGELSGAKPRADGEIGGLFRSKLILGRQLNGLMGGFRLYARALGAAEIRQLYETTGPRPSLASPPYRLRLKPHLFFSERMIKGDLYLSQAAERPGQVSAEAGLFRLGEERPLRQKTIGALPAGTSSEVSFSLEGLPPGEYEIRASAKTPEGKTFAKISTPVTLPEKPWWYDSAAGAGDGVLPPWTALQMRDGNALEIDCWGRTYTFASKPFPTRIATTGRPILAQPIRFVGRVDGHEVEWEGVNPQVTGRTPAKISFSHKSEGRGVELMANTLIEYDGLIRIDLRLKPRKAIRLEKLTLEIPLRGEHARLVYYHRDARFMASGAIPKGGVARDFNPAIWIGDEERGLQWFTVSDRDWHPADASRAIEIVPDGEKIILRLNLIGRPLELKPNATRTLTAAPGLSYTFGLQATPVKPVTKDAWDYRIVTAHRYGGDYAMLSETIGDKTALDHYAGLGVRTLLLLNWSDVLSYPAPVGHADDLRRMVTACHERGIKVICYLGAQYSERAPEFATFFDEFVNWGSGRPYSHYGYVDNYPPMPAQMTYGPCVRSHWRDMMIAGAERLMDEFDVDGFYLDGVGVAGACHNVHHGCGFVGPDGKSHATWTAFEGRDFIKRLYRIVKSRKPDGQIDVHPSSHWLSSYMAWATNVWDGETILGEDRKGANPKEGVFLLKYLPLAMFRAQFMGRPWGASVEFLDYYVPYPFERQFAVSMLHDVLVRPHISPDRVKFVSSLWRVGDAFGRKEAEWLPYWRNAEYVKVEPQGADDAPGALASLYRHEKNGVLAVVSNLAQDKRDVSVQFNLKRLGLAGGEISATDALSGEAVPMESGRLRFAEMEPVSWRLIWIRP